jgi:Domain of unknown function (DUF5667)
MEEGRASLDEILESCLDTLQSGKETVEQVLARYPQQADELRPLLEMAIWFAGHKAVVSPRPGFVSASKRRLVEQIKAGEPQAVVPASLFERIFGASGRSRRLALQLALVVVMLACLVMGGSGIAYAAQGSLPGDQLYPVKLGLEQAELAVTLSDAQDVRLHTQFSQRRLAEIEALINDSRFNEIEQAVTNYQNHVNQASSLLTQLASQNPQVAKELAVELEQTFARQAILLNRLAANVPADVRPELQRALVISNSGQNIFSAVLNSTSGTPTPTPTPTLYPSSTAGPNQAPSITPTVFAILGTPSPTAGFVITATATSNVTIILSGSATPTVYLLPTATLRPPSPTPTPRPVIVQPTPTWTPIPTDTPVPPHDTPQPPQETPKPPKPTKTPRPTRESTNPTPWPAKATANP